MSLQNYPLCKTYATIVAQMIFFSCFSWLIRHSLHTGQLKTLLWTTFTKVFVYTFTLSIFIRTKILFAINACTPNDDIQIPKKWVDKLQCQRVLFVDSPRSYKFEIINYVDLIWRSQLFTFSLALSFLLSFAFFLFQMKNFRFAMRPAKKSLTNANIIWMVKYRIGTLPCSGSQLMNLKFLRSLHFHNIVLSISRGIKKTHSQLLQRN